MSKGSNANVFKVHRKTKYNKKMCYSCGSSEHLKRDCPVGDNYGTGGEGSPAAVAKSVTRREDKRNMTTNFTQRDVLMIFGEGQVVGTLELYHMDEALHDDEQVANTVGMQKWYINTASNTHVVGDKRYFMRYRELSSDEATGVESHQSLRSSHVEWERFYLKRLSLERQRIL